jgi:hypothetical protein
MAGALTVALDQERFLDKTLLHYFAKRGKAPTHAGGHPLEDESNTALAENDRLDVRQSA